MAHPIHHSRSSVKKWGGREEDYMPIHEWFDHTKSQHGDFRHRALRHHAEGIFLMEAIFGPTLKLSICAKCGVERSEHWTTNGDDHAFKPKLIPTRWVGEQHVTEDLGYIPAATEWLSAIVPKPWMARSRRLSREEEMAQ